VVKAGFFNPDFFLKNWDIGTTFFKKNMRFCFLPRKKYLRCPIFSASGAQNTRPIFSAFCAPDPGAQIH
jgi:hypothetical protein